MMVHMTPLNSRFIRCDPICSTLTQLLTPLKATMSCPLKINGWRERCISYWKFVPFSGTNSFVDSGVYLIYEISHPLISEITSCQAEIPRLRDSSFDQLRSMSQRVPWICSGGGKADAIAHEYGSWLSIVEFESECLWKLVFFFQRNYFDHFSFEIQLMPKFGLTPVAYWSFFGRLGDARLQHFQYVSICVIDSFIMHWSYFFMNCLCFFTASIWHVFIYGCNASEPKYACFGCSLFSF